MQAFDMPAPDIDQVLRRNGLGIRFRVFEPDVKASGDVLHVLPQASRVHVATRINHILINRGA